MSIVSKLTKDIINILYQLNDNTIFNPEKNKTNLYKIGMNSVEGVVETDEEALKYGTKKIIEVLKSKDFKSKYPYSDFKYNIVTPGTNDYILAKPLSSQVSGKYFSMEIKLEFTDSEPLFTVVIFAFSNIKSVKIRTDVQEAIVVDLIESYYKEGFTNFTEKLSQLGNKYNITKIDKAWYKSFKNTLDLFVEYVEEENIADGLKNAYFFRRDEDTTGFINYYFKISKKELGVSANDSIWPADILIIKDINYSNKKIKEFKTLDEINLWLFNSMIIGDIIPISLKKIPKTGHIEEVNTEFYDKEYNKILNRYTFIDIIIDCFANTRKPKKITSNTRGLNGYDFDIAGGFIYGFDNLKQKNVKIATRGFGKEAFSWESSIEGASSLLGKISIDYLKSISKNSNDITNKFDEIKNKMFDKSASKKDKILFLENWLDKNVKKKLADLEKKFGSKILFDKKGQMNWQQAYDSLTIVLTDYITNNRSSNIYGWYGIYYKLKAIFNIHTIFINTKNKNLIFQDLMLKAQKIDPRLPAFFKMGTFMTIAVKYTYSNDNL